MSTRPDSDRSISAWLAAEAPDRAPKRLLDESRERIRMTRQRRTRWSAWTVPDMNIYARLAIGVAAALVVAVVGISLLPGRDRNAAAPIAPSPSPDRVVPPSTSPPGSPGPSPSTVAAPGLPAPSPSAPSTSAVLLDSFLGDVAIGRYATAVRDVRLQFDVTTTNWAHSAMMVYGGVLRHRGSYSASLGFWSQSPDMVVANPCDSESVRPVGPTGAELADAIAAIPGINVSGPIDTTVGGRPAKYLEVSLPVDLGCSDVEGVTLWGRVEQGNGTIESPFRTDVRVFLASGLGHTLAPRILVWIVDAQGARVFIEADIAPEVAGMEDEVRRIVDSIQFK